MPRSNHPVETTATCMPLVRSTVGAQAADETSAKQSSSRADARNMRAILEHPHLDALQRLVARDLAGEEVGQIRPAQPDDARPRVAVRGREAWPVVVALRGNRQPLGGTD